MKIDLDDLRRIYREYIAGMTSGPGDCPSETQLFRFFELRTSRRRKAAILNHVTSCASCAEIFETLIQMNRRPATQAPLTDRKRRKARLGSLPPPLWRWAAALLGASLICTSIIVLWRHPGTAPEAYRSPTESPIRLIRPIGRVPSAAVIVFEWTGISGADHYRVDLFDETLFRIWQSPPVESSPLRLPPEALRLVRPDRTYFWSVTAITQSGRAVESPLHKFVPACR